MHEACVLGKGFVTGCDRVSDWVDFLHSFWCDAISVEDFMHRAWVALDIVTRSSLH
jgi:hypothetical protein